MDYVILRITEQEGMRDYFTVEIESRQGRVLQIVLELNHGLGEGEEGEKGQGILGVNGKIEVYSQLKCYEAGVTHQNLNQDILWDSKYLQLLQQAFTTSKDKHVNMIDNKLSIIVDLAKGIRVAILTVDLKEKPGTTTQALMERFMNTQSYYEGITTDLDGSIKEVKERNRVHSMKTMRQCEETRARIKRIKEESLGMLNQMKLVIRKGRQKEGEMEVEVGKDSKTKEEVVKQEFMESEGEGEEDQQSECEEGEGEEQEGDQEEEQRVDRQRVSGVRNKRKSELAKESVDQQIIKFFLNG